MHNSGVKFRSPKDGRKIARKLYPNLGTCVRCNRPAKHRHHKDKNPFNNAADNIECLCFRCHSEEHNRKVRIVRGKTVKEWSETLGIKLCTAWQRFYSGALEYHIDGVPVPKQRRRMFSECCGIAREDMPGILGVSDDTVVKYFKAGTLEDRLIGTKFKRKQRPLFNGFSCAELMDKLGVTRQRVHRLIKTGRMEYRLTQIDAAKKTC